MKRRELLKTAGLGMLASQMPFAFAKDNKTKTQTLETVWSAPVAPAALLGVAAQRGQLSKTHPYQVKTWKTTDILRAGVASGSMPVTMAPSYVAANFYNRGKDVALANIMTFGLLYIMGNDKTIEQFEELVGKSIVMPFKNGMPDLVLQVLCKKLGIEYSALNVHYVTTPPEALALFLKGRAEFALLPEPLATAAQIKGKKLDKNIVYALNLQQQWGTVMQTTPRIPQAGMQIDRAFYQKHGNIVEQLLRDISDAALWIADNPKEAAQITANYLPVPAPILTKALPNAYLTGTPTAEIADEILFFFEQMYQLNPKIVGGKMPSKALFTL